MVIKYSISDKAVARAECDRVINLPDKKLEILIKPTGQFIDKLERIRLRLNNNGSQYLIEEEPTSSRLFLLPKELLTNRLDIQLISFNEKFEPIQTWILEPITLVNLENELQGYFKIIPDIETLSAKLESNQSEIVRLNFTIEELTKTVNELKTTIYDPSV